jgi:hypothetical protein
MATHQRRRRGQEMVMAERQELEDRDFIFVDRDLA